MAIDNCPYIFEELAQEVLPALFAELRKAMLNPMPALSLGSSKSFTKTLAGELKIEDFSGCYVFMEEKKPLYVGISRGVLNRLLQHLNHLSQNSSPWVFRMAAKVHGEVDGLTRAQAMMDERFKKIFLTEQERVRKMNIAWVKIENDLVLYLFEAYAAMKLDTAIWNTFRTH